MTRLIRKAISAWLSWRNRRELDRAYPRIRLLRKQIQAARRNHQPCRHLQNALRKEMVKAVSRPSSMVEG